MPLTRDFRETVKARAERDPGFRAALLAEALEAFAEGDLATGKALLRDLTNATIGFEGLAANMNVPAKSAMRMLSSKGNPRAENLVAAIAVLRESMRVDVKVEVQPERHAAPKGRYVSFKTGLFDGPRKQASPARPAAAKTTAPRLGKPSPHHARRLSSIDA